MQEGLTREKVLHVADLGRIALTEEEIEKYSYQLKQILDEIEKINQVDIEDKAIMISPTNNTDGYRDDETGDVLSIEEALKNAPKANGNYVEVPGVFND